MPLTPDRLVSLRPLFPHVAHGITYLNHAATSPLSVKVVSAMQQHLTERSAGPIDTYWTDKNIINDLRVSVQRLINAESPDRIGFVTSTSEGLNIVASGLQWKSGDRVLLNDMEFPANVYPYINLRRHGVEVDTLTCRDGRITPEMIEQALTPRTKIVALSAVQFLTGWKADLAAIGSLCRSRGVWFVVDGIQAVGAVRIDVQAMKIDALSAGGQKWQMAPHGSGFVYLSANMQEAVRQQFLGWLSVDDPWDFRNYGQPLAPSARRFEGGTLNYPSLMGMKAAVDLLLEVGPENVQDQILSLTDILVDRFSRSPIVTLVSPVDRERRSGIVTIRPSSPEAGKRTFDRLLSEKIVISLREGQLRISPHFYNTRDDVEQTSARLLDLLAAR